MAKQTEYFPFWNVQIKTLNGGAFAKGRNQAENIKAVIQDVLGHGNEKCLLPGQPEARAAELTRKHGGLLFTKAEIEAFNEIAGECGEKPWDLAVLKAATL